MKTLSKTITVMVVFCLIFLAKRSFSQYFSGSTCARIKRTDFGLQNGFIYNFNNAVLNTNIKHIDFSSQKMLAQSASSDITQTTTDFQVNNYLMSAENNALYHGTDELENEKNNTPLTQNPVKTALAEDKNIYDY